jgi:hypothetical protein
MEVTYLWPHLADGDLSPQVDALLPARGRGRERPRAALRGDPRLPLRGATTVC